jgi:hypothetical protein
MQTYKLSREKNFGCQIVFTDGLSGTGKTALFNIINSLGRVETVRFDHIYEYLCAMKYLKRVNDDVIASLMQLNMDRTLNNVMLSRQVNFRPADNSSVLSGLNRNKYLSRLFEPESELTLEKINQERPIVHIMSHSLLGISQPLFEVFNNRITLIEIERHPVNLIPAWVSYIDRYGTDPFELTVCFRYNNKDLPWFSKGWEKEYLKSNTYDKAIRAFNYFNSLKKTFFNESPKQITNRIIQIPFEKYVINPFPYIEQIENKLKITRNKDIHSILNQQKMPRKTYSDIPSDKSYEKYNNFTIEDGTTEDDIKDEIWVEVNDHASAECKKMLRKLVKNYNVKYANT